VISPLARTEIRRGTNDKNRTATVRSRLGYAIVIDKYNHYLSSYNEKFAEILELLFKLYNLGAKSIQWLKWTFGKRVVTQPENAHYVTANMFSDEPVPDDVRCAEVSKTGFDDGMSTVPPRAMTDTPIQLDGRNHQIG
jgi:hypothetical protein